MPTPDHKIVVVPDKGWMTRQRHRQFLRGLGQAVLTKLIGQLPRRSRRIGARAYGNTAYIMATRGQFLTRHRYDGIVLNRDVLNWVVSHGRVVR